MLSSATLGLLLATFSSLTFGLYGAILSGLLLQVEPAAVNTVVNITGLVLLFFVMLATNQAIALWVLTPTFVLIFASVGVLHFGLSRLLMFTGIRHIGANAWSTLTPINVILTLVLATILLGERVNSTELVGAVAIVLGASLIGTRESAVRRAGSLSTGVTTTLFGATIWGITPILIKAGLTISPSYIDAIFIAFVAAVLFDAVLDNPLKALKTVRHSSRLMILYTIGGGALSAAAQTSKFAALGAAPVPLVIPIIATYPIITVVGTWFLSRETEIFGLRTIFCILLVIAGAGAIGYSSSG